ncbi:MAG: hypothetical protein ACO3JL_09805 [Myxococcota bacterium]
MSLHKRLVLMMTLPLALWFLWDAMHCFRMGRFVSRVLSPQQAPAARGVVVMLEDGTLVEYGLWARAFEVASLDPHVAAPFLVVLGVVGLVGLFLFLARRQEGWSLLLVFAVGSLWYLTLGTVLGFLLLLVLLAPRTRREVFGVDEREAGTLRLEVSPDT